MAQAKKKRVGRKGAVKVHAKARAPKVDWREFADSVFFARISTIISVFLLFFATAAVMVGIAAGINIFFTDQYAANLNYQPLAQASRTRVLGVSVKSYDAALSYKTKYIAVTVKPFHYSQEAGKWNYIVHWERNANYTGSILIDGKVAVSDASGTGDYYTDYTLTPASRLKIAYLAKQGGKGGVVFSRTIKVLPAEAQETANVRRGEVVKACTQDAKVCPDGSAVGRVGPSCEFAPCPEAKPVAPTETSGRTSRAEPAPSGTPSYGYSNR